MFVEPSGKGMAKLPEDSYKTVFQADPGWIKGAGVTVEPDGTAPGFDKFVLQGVDWRKLLTSGKKYKLRQHFYRGAKMKHQYDVSYVLTFERNKKAVHTIPNPSPAPLTVPRNGLLKQRCH